MISEFKARLSEYLASVRRGETIVVCDRKTPVARVLPPEAESWLSITPPSRKPRRIADIAGVPPGGDVDADVLLRELRGER